MHRLVPFLLLTFFLSPNSLLAASDPAELLLSAKMYRVRQSEICLYPNDCQALFLIEGKNFVNSNPRGGVKIGSDWMKILRWTDTQIVGTTSLDHKKKVPIVAVDKRIHRPTLVSTDPVLQKMFAESVEVALQSVKQASDGSRYFVAGPKYTSPERTYYRDSYWTSGLLLYIEPAFVRDQILLLARGVEKNGSVPSAIPVNPKDRKIPLWTNHYDSGPYFVMIVHDYIRFTGDETILRESVNGRTVFETLSSIFMHLASQDANKNSLPEKPENSKQDWLDTIPRSGEVISNEVLYYQALSNMSEIAMRMKRNDLATQFDALALRVRDVINNQFWNEQNGFYEESCDKGACDSRLTNESSLAILYDVIEPKNRDRFFQNLQSLETRMRSDIHYGDFGLLNAYPFYPNAGREYVYHNGADWPFLDGINAGARLKYNNKDWYYPLTQWFVYFDAHRRTGERLPEFISPIDANHGVDQAWSTYPIAALLKYGFGLDPDASGVYTQKASPIGAARLSDIVIRGKRLNVDLK